MHFIQPDNSDQMQNADSVLRETLPLWTEKAPATKTIADGFSVDYCLWKKS